jgi:hypothetical protein
VAGYSLTNASFSITFGNPTYPGLFVTNRLSVTNASTWANSGAGNLLHFGNTTNSYNGTNVLTGNFANLTANVSTFGAGTVGTAGGANLPYQLTVWLAQTNAITATNVILATANAVTLTVGTGSSHRGAECRPRQPAPGRQSN